MNIYKCPECKRERYVPENSVMMFCRCCQVVMEVLEDGL